MHIKDYLSILVICIMLVSPDIMNINTISYKLLGACLMLKEFKEFISRGNVIDLAVGVIIGGAFTAIVTSLTTNIINPFIGIFLGKIDLSKLSITIGQATFKYGAFLNSVINFLIIAFVVFILIKIINRLVKKQPQTPVVDRKEVLLSEIKELLEQQNK
ncbi:large conductance mechanosensitive channel protein [Lentilactobacillus kisonensis F0435]|uniref:Large-conductance mechanosensitive channel n=2 Tax=Lentilactobacillus kisonensis TaxID=481722 RepID=H1LKX5_9LACO|nr:large conductance mechanosensitive channel protein [Lentilactobacillus kisonensis F0435]